MSDFAHLKEIQEEIKNDVQSQLLKFFDAMDLRDREQAKRINSLETDNDHRLSRIESAVESLLKNAADSQHDDRNSHLRPPFQTRSVKLEFPRFDGSHAIEWIFKAEQFFEYYNIP